MQVLARKDGSGVVDSCVNSKSTTSSPPRNLRPPARFVYNLNRFPVLCSGLNSRFYVPLSGPRLGLTSNISVSSRFYVQCRDLPDRPELPQLSIQPCGKLVLSQRVLVPQRWFTPLEKALDETVLLSLVTSYSDENYADYGAKTPPPPLLYLQSSPAFQLTYSPVPSALESTDNKTKPLEMFLSSWCPASSNIDLAGLTLSTFDFQKCSGNCYIVLTNLTSFSFPPSHPFTIFRGLLLAILTTSSSSTSFISTTTRAPLWACSGHPRSRWSFLILILVASQ